MKIAMIYVIYQCSREFDGLSRKQDADDARSLARLPLSSISPPERLITLAETNGSRYDYEG